MKSSVLILAATLAMFAGPAFAEAQCYQSNQFLVIAQDRTDEVGTDFIIRPPARGKIACLYEPTADDVVISNAEDPLHYEKLVGQYLVLTRSTGPQGDLVIYDLANYSFFPMLDVGASDDIVVTEDSVTYWQELILGSEINCDTYAENSSYDLGSMIYEERILDLATQTVAATGKTQCLSTQ